MDGKQQVVITDELEMPPWPWRSVKRLPRGEFSSGCHVSPEPDVIITSDTEWAKTFLDPIQSPHQSKVLVTAPSGKRHGASLSDYAKEICKLRDWGALIVPWDELETVVNKILACATNEVAIAHPKVPPRKPQSVPFSAVSPIQPQSVPPTIQDVPVALKPRLAVRSVAPEPRATTKDIPPALKRGVRRRGYELLVFAGKGGGGSVFLARENGAGRIVALKVLTGPLSKREREAIRFYQNLCLKHPILAPCLNCGRIGRGKDATYFVVWPVADCCVNGSHIDPAQYVPMTANSLSLRGRPVTPKEFFERLEIARQILRQLFWLHNSNLTHNDIKDSNIIRCNGEWKLIDFSLMRLVGLVENSGTKFYLPPEGSGRISGDLYSLGMTLYVLVTGLTANRFPDLPDFPPGAHHGRLKQLTQVLLEEIVQKACDPDPTRRFQFVMEFECALNAFVQQFGRNS